MIVVDSSSTGMDSRRITTGCAAAAASILNAASKHQQRKTRVREMTGKAPRCFKVGGEQDSTQESR